MHQGGRGGDKGAGEGDEFEFVRTAGAFVILYHTAQHHVHVGANCLRGHHHHFCADRIAFLRHCAARTASWQKWFVHFTNFRLHHQSDITADLGQCSGH